MPDVEISDDGRSSIHHYFSYSNPSLDKYVDDAIERMADQPEPLKAAANLLQRWFEAGTLPPETCPICFSITSANGLRRVPRT